jgi:predicted DNA-binding protein (UPF0251 family)
LSAAAQVLFWVRASIQQTIEDPNRETSPRRSLREPVRNRPRPVSPELAFYRKYTEAMLLRYVSMSMEAGRVPSLLGKEMFRGKVTRYEVHSFEDVVIFIHDMEACLRRLDADQQWLIRRIAIQQFTQEEAGKMLGIGRRTIIRRYNDAINRLTGILLEVNLLEPVADWQRSCQ